MSQLVPYYELTKRDIAKDKLLRLAAAGFPLVLPVVPALVFFLLFLVSSLTPTAAMFLFLSLISLVAGFVLGLAGSGLTMLYRSRWLTGLREQLAADGIKAEEVDWFKNELKGSEKKALKDLREKTPLLADAYQETLASRLTATRIIKSSGYELVLAKRRENKLKYLKSENLEEFREEIKKDIENISRIREEAKEMQIESESRLQMIEAAARRGTELAGNEMALKKLNARSAQLPLALEEAKMEEELRKEFVDQLEQDFESEVRELDLAGE